MVCEICGSPNANRRAAIEGVVVKACGFCVSYGKEVIEQRASEGLPFEIPEIRQDCASAIRIARQQRGILLEDLSRAVGESESILRRIENGGMLPPPELARKLERRLGIDILDKPGKRKADGKRSSKVTVGEVAELV